ncbi:hypothetical protein LOK49_LG03G02740 [Camellia lanceoleosa]|uniref:Uncharacterized protein n=1 Tax=Camellia lanceoleosa TaxID=1840588 RepID=A0ACC0ICV2_9ERIC|nr:hypothetical protein LOK49_LG03G02740 [Camellia lanceoleosa]
MVSLIIVALAWCSMLVMLGIETGIYIRVPVVCSVWSCICVGGGCCDAQSHSFCDRFLHRVSILLINLSVLYMYLITLFIQVLKMKTFVSKIGGWLRCYDQAFGSNCICYQIGYGELKLKHGSVAYTPHEDGGQGEDEGHEEELGRDEDDDDKGDEEELGTKDIEDGDEFSKEP